MSALLALWVLSPESRASREANLKQRLEKSLTAYNSSIKREQLGLAVVELVRGEAPLLFSLNAEREMIPASVTKVVTAAAVLRQLGASHKLQTTLWSAAGPVAGVVEGDLVLKGGGDSGFVSESMWFLVNELVRAGVKRVNGNVVVDDTAFDAVRADSSRDPERVDRAYDAPVGAMSFNWNSMNIYVRPTSAGQPPQVYLDPIDNGYTIVNRAKTTATGGSAIEVQRDGERVIVKGSIGQNQNEAVFYKNIDDPVEWSGRNLIFFLKQRGIEVKGKVVAGRYKEGMKLLAKADSKPISQAVADMMKFSNNYVAEMLTKNLALARAPEAPATLAAGMKIVVETALSLGLQEGHFTLVNPSGLSRQNRLRARDLVQVLVASYRHFPTFAELLAAYPLAGMDGTLKNRIKEHPGWVRAKTGLLSGVTGLAGYAGRKDGSLYAFAFIFNGKAEQGDSARRLFDALAQELVQ